MAQMPALGTRPKFSLSAIHQDEFARVAQLFLKPFERVDDPFQTFTGNGLLPLAHQFGRFQDVAWTMDMEPACRNIAFKNLRLSSEMTRLSQLFEKNGVRIVPWKGPSLTLELYGDLSLRPFSDLDFLVADDQVNQAMLLLQSEGYLPQFPHDRHPHLLPFDQRCTIELFHPELNIHLDLTFKLIPLSGSKLQVREMIHRASLQDVLGASILRLTPEDLLLSLCAHGSKHGWSRRSWLLDIFLIMSKYPGMNGEKVLEQAQRFGQSKHLSSGMLALTQVVPEDSWNVPPLCLDMHQPRFTVIYSKDLSPKEEIRLLFKLHDHRQWCKTFTYMCCPSIHDWRQSNAQHFFSFALWSHRLSRSIHSLQALMRTRA